MNIGLTTLQIIVFTCAYAVALAAAVYFTRAPLRRVMGALAGGAAAGCFGMGAIVLGNALGVWRVPLSSTPGVLGLFYVGLAISVFTDLSDHLASGSPVSLARDGGLSRRRGSHRSAARLSVRCALPGVDGVCEGRRSRAGRRRSLSRPCGGGTRRDVGRQRPRARRPLGATALNGRLTPISPPLSSGQIFSVRSSSYIHRDR